MNTTTSVRRMGIDFGRYELTHLVCECSPDDALCGTDVTDSPYVDDDDNDCPICVDMEWTPCRRCGLT